MTRSIERIAVVVALGWLAVAGCGTKQSDKPVPANRTERAEPTVPATLEPVAADCSLRVTYLANMGVMLEGDGKTVVIDGVHRFYAADYAILPDAEQSALEGAEGRFADIDIIIATHQHGDHFHAEAVANHLAANPKARFYGPEPAAEAILDLGTVDGGRVTGIPAAQGSIVSPVRTDASTPVPQLRFLGIEHAGSHTLPNMGVVVELAGARVFHSGDAEAGAIRDPKLAESLADLDAAILPAWYFSGELPVTATHVIASHISPRGAATSAKRLLGRGAVGAFIEPMTSYPLCRRAPSP